MSVRTLSNIRVDIETPTRTNDRRGGQTTTWADRYSSMPCRLEPMKGDEQNLYGSERTPVTHKAFVPPEYTGITEADRLVYGTRVLDIVLIIDVDQMGHHFELMLREIKEAI